MSTLERISVQQNDPAELLEVCDAGGRATGQAKTRAAIHLDGDWHRAFHCWILRRADSEVVLQRRSLTKDTFAGCWDAAAAGHWRFGESAAEAAREITEELGLSVPFEALEYRGRERAAHRFSNGLTDREFHEIYVLRDDRPLREYRPDPGEVIGLAAFGAAELIALASGGVASIMAREAVTVRDDGALIPTELSVGPADVVPYRADRLRRTMLGPS